MSGTYDIILKGLINNEVNRKMKNLLIGFIALAGLVGCQSEVNVTQPLIFIGTNSPIVLDSLEISVTEYADIEGERIVPDYYEWTILDINEVILCRDFENSKDIIWVPDISGTFIISVKIGYDGNKSITALKEITINESNSSLQQKLVGSWTGTGETRTGINWKIDITFTENGHYIATAYDISDTQNLLSPFWFGYKEVTYPPGGTMLVAPSADIPCQSFIIDEVIDNKGFGELNIGYEYAVDGEPYTYDCSKNFKIQYLSFSNGSNNVYFSLIEYGFVDYEWYLRYNLEKVE